MIYEGKVLLEMANYYKEQTYENLPSRWTLALEKDEYIIHPYHPSPFLFRGQNRRYSPCYTSLLRGIKNAHLMSELTVDEQAVVVLRQARVMWFNRELKIHPIYQWAKNNKVYINTMALAQHYELATGYMDVSQSFNVAAFFATCKRSEKGEWMPMKEGQGIVYMIDRSKIDYEFLEPIGLQPFPRPEEQWAWVLEVPMGCDFENHPALSYIEFKHNEDVSNYFLEKFDKGNKLFPVDPLSEIAEKIQNSKVIGKDLIEGVINGFINLEGGILQADSEKVLEATNKLANLSDKTQTIITDTIIDTISEIWKNRKDSFANSIVPTYVRLEPVKNS